ncbi:MAG TPA: hypothetical protein DDY98_01310 [Ruminococcaceae bacterium]|nr:hypothetical protein [Oscillospiraceae bacterium]
MLAITAEILFAALLLVGVWNREKLIAFEAHLSDCLAKWVAGIIMRRRAVRIRKARALQARQAQQVRRPALHVVEGCKGSGSNRSIA